MNAQSTPTFIPLPLSRAVRVVLPGLVLICLAGAVTPLSAQPLSRGRDLTPESEPAEADTIPPAPRNIVLGQVVGGTVLAAGAGLGVGLIGEALCDDCDASEPGGDTPGMVLGVPLATVAGVWFVGKWAPLPHGRLQDTVIGALVGTAVFAGFAELLKEQGRGLRWAGVVFPAAVSTMGWHRSRSVETLSLGVGSQSSGLRAELVVVRFRF